MKRRAVYGVNNGWNMQRRSRQPTQKAGFRAMRMDNLGLEMANGPLQGKIAGGIAPGVDRPSQTGDDLYRYACSPALLEQITFRSQSRAGYQQDVISEQLDQVLAVVKCILLRSTNNHSSNQVSDAHENKYDDESLLFYKSGFQPEK